MATQGVAHDQQPIEFAGVRFGLDDVSELEDGRVMVKVPKAQIRRIALREGFYSAHPVVQVIAGIVLSGIAVPPTWHLATWIVGGGTFVSIEAWLIAFMFIGPWLVYDALKRGRYLQVETVAGRKKLILDRRADARALEEFLAAVEQRLGYSIDRSVASK